MHGLATTRCLTAKDKRLVSSQPDETCGSDMVRDKEVKKGTDRQTDRKLLLHACPQKEQFPDS